MSQIKGNTMITAYVTKAKELEFIIYKDAQLIDLTGLTGTIRVYLDIPGSNGSDVISKALTIPAQTGTAEGTCSVVFDDDDTDITAAVYNYQLIFVYDTDDNRVLQAGTINLVGDDEDRVSQIKQKYGFSFDNYTLNDALNYARSQLLNIGYQYIEKTISGTDTNDCFLIENYVMDKDFSGVVDVDDLVLFEYMNESPYTINDLTANISSVTFNHPKGYTIVEMDGTYPSSSSYKMEIQYYKGLQTYSYLFNDIKFLEELLMIYHLFDVLPIYKLQHGIKKREINGIKVEFNDEAIYTLKKDLRTKINYQIGKIRSLGGKAVYINKDYGVDNGVYNYGMDNSATRYRNFDERF